jgi:AbrB family looped-hinge helix DNA binding protein
MEAKVTSKGQVTLPAALRDRLGIEPGDRLVFIEMGDGTVSLRVRSGTLASLRGILHGKVEPPGDRELAEWIDAARSRAVPGGSG